MTTLDYAISYLSKGYSVIPLQPKGKKPITAWKEYQDRHPTMEELVKWFKNTENNIGIVTGKISGITVLDCDSKEAESLAKKLGLPVTPTVKTGRGRHYYFKYAEGSRNFQKRDDLPGIDLRSDGGYCFTKGHRVAVRPKNKRYKNTKSIAIERLNVGDIVSTFNEKTGEIENKPIVKIGSREVCVTRILKFGSRQGSLRCTGDHPIYTKKGWMNAGGIKTKDELLHFTRDQLGFGKAGHTFKKGVQNRIDKNTGNYQKRYRQTRPSHSHGKSKYEEFVEEMALQDNLPISFVGDGELVISHAGLLLHPDFKVKGKKKVIEIHIGFHSMVRKEGEKKTLRTASQEERKKMYEAEGWDCLLVDASNWQSFNKDTVKIINQVREKIVKYISNGKPVEFNHEMYEKVTVYNIEVADNHNYFVASKDENRKDWYLAHNCVAPPSIHPNGTVYEHEAIDEII